MSCHVMQCFLLKYFLISFKFDFDRINFCDFFCVCQVMIYCFYYLLFFAAPYVLIEEHDSLLYSCGVSTDVRVLVM